MVALRLVSRGEAGQAGQAVIEFALTLPLMALILLGLVDLGRISYAYVAVVNAAREGARYCALYPGDSAGTRARVQGELGGRVTVDLTGVTCAAATSGQPVSVVVTSSFFPVTPFVSNITGGTIHVQAPATMVVP